MSKIKNPEEILGKRFRAKNTEYPIYMPAKTTPWDCNWYTYFTEWYKDTSTGFGDIDELIKRINNGELEELKERE